MKEPLDFDKAKFGIQRPVFEPSTLDTSPSELHLKGIRVSGIARGEAETPIIGCWLQPCTMVHMRATVRKLNLAGGANRIASAPAAIQ
jgi:hypothetical protein